MKVEKFNGNVTEYLQESLLTLYVKLDVTVFFYKFQ